MTSDEIELFSEIRQRRLWIDSRDYAADPEELARGAPKCVVACVQSESFVAKETTEVKKVPGAAAQVENVKWRRAIEPEVLDVLHVNADPVHRVFVGVDSSRVRPVRIMSAQPFQFRLINRGQDPPRANGMSPPGDVLPQALRSIERKQFLEFARKSHAERCSERMKGQALTDARTTRFKHEDQKYYDRKAREAPHVFHFQSRILVISSGAEGAVEKSQFYRSCSTSAARSSQRGFSRLIRLTFFARDHFFSWDSRAIASRISR